MNQEGSREDWSVWHAAHGITGDVPAWVSLQKEQVRQQTVSGNRVDIEMACFRLPFQYTDPGRISLRVSANTRFKLYLNGVRIATGPRKGDGKRHYYEAIHCEGPFQEGENVLAAEVVSFPPREAWTEGNIGPSWAVGNAAGPCLLVSGSWHSLTREETVNLSTGCAPWRVRRMDAVTWKLFSLSFWHGPLEEVHADKLPIEWKLPDAGKISDVEQVGWMDAACRWPLEDSPYGVIPVFPLIPNPLPPMRDVPGEFSGVIPHRTGEAPLLDFTSGWAQVPPDSIRIIEWNAGTLKTAYPAFRFRGGKGSRIRLLYAEAYGTPQTDGSFAKGIRDDSLHQELTGHEDVLLPDGRDWTYEPFWFRVFRFLRMEVETGGQSLEVAAPFYRETGYPLEIHSTVASSEPWISQVYEISVRTLKCCMQETHVDCPYYEQMQYTLDTRLQILFTHALGGDTRLALLAMEDYHASLMPEGMIQSRCPSGDPQVIPFFAPAWIQMIEDHWLQTGDLGPARRYRPTMDAILDWFERHRASDGLIGPTPYWQILDATPEWRETQGAPEAVLHGPSVLLNLMVVVGLQSAGRLVEATGRPELAREYRLRADEMMAVIDSTCWVEERGMLREGPAFDQYSQQTQALAVLTGLLTEGRAKTALSNALSGPEVIRCGYPMTFYLLRALEKTGQYQLASSLLENWRQMLDLHLTTTPEFPENTRSDCHAWSAIPIHEFLRCLLGVKPAAPGWEAIRIEPRLLNVPDANGTVWTPMGEVHVNWKQEGDCFHIEGNAPVGVDTTLVLPDGSLTHLPGGGPFQQTTCVSPGLSSRWNL